MPVDLMIQLYHVASISIGEARFCAAGPLLRAALIRAARARRKPAAGLHRREIEP
jgi:hypothetical protein